MKRTAASILPPVIAACLLLCSCFSDPQKLKLEIEEQTVTDQSVGLNFSMHLRDGQLNMIYPSLDALSLNLVSGQVLPAPLRPALADTKYLDRISYSPDIGESFGRHLFLADDRFLNVLYVDQEIQENSVLKWLRKTGTEETWWIDAFPGMNEPLAAVPEQEGNLQVVVPEGNSLALYRLRPGGQPLQLASTVLPSGPLQPVGRTWVVRQRDAWACSVYDNRSKRLYLIHPGADSLGIEAVYAAAEVHYSTILDDRLNVLLFDPAESTITLLERGSIWDREADRRAFEVLPVTLCEGTSSVFLTDYNGQHLFLFNERVIDQRQTNGYQLSMLYPEPGGEYEKLALVEGDTNIQGFTALADADTLYVLYLRAEKLSLLSVSLRKLVR